MDIKGTIGLAGGSHVNRREAEERRSGNIKGVGIILQLHMRIMYRRCAAVKGDGGHAIRGAIPPKVRLRSDWGSQGIAMDGLFSSFFHAGRLGPRESRTEYRARPRGVRTVIYYNGVTCTCACCRRDGEQQKWKSG